MPKLRIIARFNDGRMLKGHTENFNPGGPTFNLHPIDVELTTITGIIVAVKDLKALFVVKSFEGNPQQDGEQPKTLAAQPTGNVLRVTFKDGEQLLGTSMNYDPGATGFFVFPVDPDSNNLRVFVINDFVKSVDHVNMSKAG